MANPTVSVVMSVCNGARYLREAIDSILDQSFTGFEFIIVNDGSTDGTNDILASYDDSRIVLIQQENMGLTKSLNTAIARARGTYVARQDADDRSRPDRIAAQVTFLAAHPEIAMVDSAVEVIANDGRRLATFRHPTEPAEIRAALATYNCFWHGSVMMKRDSFLALSGYDGTFVTAQDYDLWLRFNERYPLANLSDPLYAYRFTTESVTVKKMGSQHRMADLARRRAAERAGASTPAMDPDQVAAYLSSPLTGAERIQMIRNYKPWCRLLMENGLVDEAARLMTEMLKYHPSLLFRLACRVRRHLNPKTNLQRFLEYA